VVALAVVVTMMVVVLQEKVFICAVRRESDSSDAEAREQALEAVEAAEGTVIPPCLTGNLLAPDHTTHRRNNRTCEPRDRAWRRRRMGRPPP
jgi:hypothetical protein